MIESVLAQARFGWSVLTGRRLSLRALDRLVDTLAETQAEYGRVSSAGREFLAGPTLDGAAIAGLQRQRLRAQLVRALETAYYRPRLRALGLNPKSLTLDDFLRLPVTPKEDLRERPHDFVRDGAATAFRTTTTGTTGLPTAVFFSAHEVQVTVLLNAIGLLSGGRLGPEDIVQFSTSSRATLGNQCFSRACERIGALWFQAGLVEPATGLSLLSQRHRLPGKRSQVSFLNTYSSYLGELICLAEARGMGPADFGLHTVSVGGEPVSPGLLERARRLFGPVHFDIGYALTETWPFGGLDCEQGHLHFDPAQGLVELFDLDTGLPAAPGALGSIIATPFAPFRDASVVLRYDTGDLARALPAAPSCRLRRLPATGPIEGKRRLAARTLDGWVTPRQVISALESIEGFSLPARCGFWAEGDGVAIEVAPGPMVEDRSLPARIAEALLAAGVPLVRLSLVDGPQYLTLPFPWRGDLRESEFTRV